MINNYRSFTVSAEPNENVVKIIYKILKEEGNYYNPFFELHYVGFYGIPGKEFTLNGKTMKMPNSGYFITPYSANGYLKINSLSFSDGCENMEIYCIY